MPQYPKSETIIILKTPETETEGTKENVLRLKAEILAFYARKTIIRKI